MKAEVSSHPQHLAPCLVRILETNYDTVSELVYPGKQRSQPLLRGWRKGLNETLFLQALSTLPGMWHGSVMRHGSEFFRVHARPPGAV